jgi:pyruvate-formate lyase
VTSNRAFGKILINVRGFNYAPYEGDASFLAEATGRTRNVWEKLLVQEPQGSLDLRRPAGRGDALERPNDSESVGISCIG